MDDLREESSDSSAEESAEEAEESEESASPASPESPSPYSKFGLDLCLEKQVMCRERERKNKVLGNNLEVDLFAT